MSIYILFVFIILICISRRSFNLSNPLFFLWTTWGISFCICLLNIFSVYPLLSINSIFFILFFLFFTSLSFLLGKSLPIEFKKTHYNEKKLFQSYTVVFFIVFATYILTIIKLGLPPLLSSGGVRSEYYLSNGGELFYLMVYPCFFLGLYIFYYFKNQINFWPLVIQQLILFAIILSRGNKMAIFSVLLMMCFFWGEHVKSIYLIGLVAIVIFIFSFVSIIYKRNIENLDALKTAKITLTGFNLPDSLYFLYDPSIYLASNLYNINGLIREHLNGIGLGTFTFKGISQLLAPFSPTISSMMSNSLIIANTSLSVATFSTYSGLGQLYFDFGPIVAIMVFMLVGFLNGIVNIPPRKFKLNLTSSFFAFILFQTLALSFFTFYLGNLEVISNLFVIFAIDMYSRKSSYLELEEFDE